MTTEKMAVHAVGSEDKWLHQAGGIAALAIGVSYIVIIFLYARAGAPPVG